MRFFLSMLALAGLAPMAFANLIITNWCDVDVTFVQSVNAGCDAGVNGVCTSNGGTPFRVPAGNGQGTSQLTLAYKTAGQSVSVKLKKAGGNAGVLQYEYSVTNAVYWDLSDIDGTGPGLAGSPFAQNNVKVQPSGAGVGVGTCTALRCPAGQQCKEAYQNPDEKKTHSCPLNTGLNHLHLCMPAANM